MNVKTGIVTNVANAPSNFIKTLQTQKKKKKRKSEQKQRETK
jgi:hypothetical protein